MGLDKTLASSASEIELAQSVSRIAAFSAKVGADLRTFVQSAAPGDFDGSPIEERRGAHRGTSSRPWRFATD